MRKIIFSLCWLFAANAIAQVNVNWKTPVEGNAKSIYFHAFTQTPIVETSSYYYGMNTIDHSVVWSVKKIGKNGGDAGCPNCKQLNSFQRCNRRSGSGAVL